MSEEFENFLATHGIQHGKSTPLWPQATDEVERQNRTSLKSLKVAEAEGKKWKEELDKFLLAFRDTHHSSTGAAPGFLMFGRELKTKLPEQRRGKNVFDEGVSDRAWSHKLFHKAYADNSRGAAKNPVMPGDRVWTV